MRSGDVGTCVLSSHILMCCNFSLLCQIPQVDNCSYTARLGSRKWAPRFDYIFDQQVSNASHASHSIESTFAL